MAMPDLTQFWMMIYGGSGYDAGAAFGYYQSLAAGIPQTGNPPYTLNDFLAIYPKFFGAPSVFPGIVFTAGNPVVLVQNTAGLAVNQLVTAAPVLPAGTVIQNIVGSNVTLSNAPTLTQPATMSVYTAPLVPMLVLQTYLNLATAGLMSSRWRASWTLGMALYIAHFATLWLQSEGNPQTTAGQIVANALQTGILVSESADGVSASFQPLAAVDSWAAWAQTTYGVQLVTMARAVGAGAVYIR